MALNHLKLAGLISLSLSIAACSIQPKQALQPVKFEPQDRFIAEGKLGIRTTELTESARFLWKQNQEDFLIQLLDPFGRSVMRLQSEASSVSLQLNDDEEVFSAQSPEALMQALLGWQVPVAAARYWIQGIPDPNQTSKFLKSGHFLQSGWEIELRQVQDLGVIQGAPRRVQLLRDDLRLTLIFSDWLFPD